MYKGLVITEEMLRAAAEQESLARALEFLGIPKGNRYYKWFRTECDKYGIDHSFSNRYLTQRIPLAEIMVADSEYVNNRINLKKRILDAGLLQNVCAWCGHGPEWNGKPLVLQLDHINGKNNDHRLENLRILCPNCHTQTTTYAGRKRNE